MFRVYFKGPYSFDELSAELVDDRDKTLRLIADMRGTLPNRNEKSLDWLVPRGAADSNVVYTLRIIKVHETNAVPLVDIRVGRLSSLSKK